MSSALWLARLLKLVMISTIVPITISNMPIKGVNFFIQSLNLLQKYKIIMNYALKIMNYFVPLHPHFAKITFIY